jgi:hypothetical protein
MEKIQKTSVILCAIHHRQNPIKSTSQHFMKSEGSLTVFTRALSWSPSSFKFVQSVPPHRISPTDIPVLYLRLDLPSGLLLSGITTKTPVYIPLLSHA